MNKAIGKLWQDKFVTPEQVIGKIKPGMSIFIGTGVAEPGTMDRTLINSTAGNLADLELIQLVSFGDVISLGKLRSQQFRIPFYDERI
jgi:acyl-CoA hydrolase